MSNLSNVGEEEKNDVKSGGKVIYECDNGATTRNIDGAPANTSQINSDNGNSSQPHDDDDDDDDGIDLKSILTSKNDENSSMDKTDETDECRKNLVASVEIEALGTREIKHFISPQVREKEDISLTGESSNSIKEKNVNPIGKEASKNELDICKNLKAHKNNNNKNKIFTQDIDTITNPITKTNTVNDKVCNLIPAPNQSSSCILNACEDLIIKSNVDLSGTKKEGKKYGPQVSEKRIEENISASEASSVKVKQMDCVENEVIEIMCKDLKRVRSEMSVDEKHLNCLDSKERKKFEQNENFLEIERSSSCENNYNSIKYQLENCEILKTNSLTTVELCEKTKLLTTDVNKKNLPEEEKIKNCEENTISNLECSQMWKEKERNVGMAKSDSNKNSQVIEKEKEKEPVSKNSDTNVPPSLKEADNSECFSLSINDKKSECKSAYVEESNEETIAQVEVKVKVNNKNIDLASKENSNLNNENAIKSMSTQVGKSTVPPCIDIDSFLKEKSNVSPPIEIVGTNKEKSFVGENLDKSVCYLKQCSVSSAIMTNKSDSTNENCVVTSESGESSLIKNSISLSKISCFKTFCEETIVANKSENFQEENVTSKNDFIMSVSKEEKDMTKETDKNDHKTTEADKKKSNQLLKNNVICPSVSKELVNAKNLKKPTDKNTDEKKATKVSESNEKSLNEKKCDATVDNISINLAEPLKKEPIISIAEKESKESEPTAKSSLTAEKTKDVIESDAVCVNLSCAKTEFTSENSMKKSETLEPEQITKCWKDSNTNNSINKSCNVSKKCSKNVQDVKKIGEGQVCEIGRVSLVTCEEEDGMKKKRDEVVKVKVNVNVNVNVIEGKVNSGDEGENISEKLICENPSLKFAHEKNEKKEGKKEVSDEKQTSLEKPKVVVQDKSRTCTSVSESGCGSEVKRRGRERDENEMVEGKKMLHTQESKSSNDLKSATKNKIESEILANNVHGVVIKNSSLVLTHVKKPIVSKIDLEQKPKLIENSEQLFSKDKSVEDSCSSKDIKSENKLTVADPNENRNERKVNSFSKHNNMSEKTETPESKNSTKKRSDLLESEKDVIKTELSIKSIDVGKNKSSLLESGQFSEKMKTFELKDVEREGSCVLNSESAPAKTIKFISEDAGEGNGNTLISETVSKNTETFKSKDITESSDVLKIKTSMSKEVEGKGNVLKSEVSKSKDNDVTKTVEISDSETVKKRSELLKNTRVYEKSETSKSVGTAKKGEDSLKNETSKSKDNTKSCGLLKMEPISQKFEKSESKNKSAVIECDNTSGSCVLKDEGNKCKVSDFVCDSIGKGKDASFVESVSKLSDNSHKIILNDSLITSTSKNEYKKPLKKRVNLNDEMSEASIKIIKKDATELKAKSLYESISSKTFVQTEISDKNIQSESGSKMSSTLEMLLTKKPMMSHSKGNKDKTEEESQKKNISKIEELLKGSGTYLTAVKETKLTVENKNKTAGISKKMKLSGENKAAAILKQMTEGTKHLGQITISRVKPIAIEIECTPTPPAVVRSSSVDDVIERVVAGQGEISEDCLLDLTSIKGPKKKRGRPRKIVPGAVFNTPICQDSHEAFFFPHDPIPFIQLSQPSTSSTPSILPSFTPTTPSSFPIFPTTTSFTSPLTPLTLTTSTSTSTPSALLITPSILPNLVPAAHPSSLSTAQETSQVDKDDSSQNVQSTCGRSIRTCRTLKEPKKKRIKKEPKIPKGRSKKEVVPVEKDPEEEARKEKELEEQIKRKQEEKERRYKERLRKLDLRNKAIAEKKLKLKRRAEERKRQYYEKKQRLQEEKAELERKRALAPPETFEEETQMGDEGEDLLINENNRNKKGRMEVIDPESSKEFKVHQVAEYQWPLQGGEFFMLQEQISQYLGVKSFKRKYPDIKRRPIEAEERTFLCDSGLVSETMCDLGLTAVRSADVLDIMFADFADKYEEFRKHLRDMQAKEFSLKQLALAGKPTGEQLDTIERAVQSAAKWNSALNKSRQESRRCALDLQTFVIQYPRSRHPKMTKYMPKIPKMGNYPLSLIPGQYTDYYKQYSASELRYFPLNTVLYGPIKPYEVIIREAQDNSDSDDSSSSDESSGSSYDDCSEEEDSCNEIAMEVDGNERQRQGAMCKICRGDKNKNKKNKPEVLIHCAQCTNSCHPTCLDLSVGMVPYIQRYEWQCTDCKKCAQCKEAADEDKMLFCDLCDRGYHIYCVGLRKVPTGRWHCQECAICCLCGVTEPGTNDTALWHHEYKRSGRGGKNVYLRTFCENCAKTYDAGEGNVLKK